MTLLIDTDAFCKLGLAGLLEDAVALFGATLSDCARLPALPHMLRRGTLVRRFGLDTCNALLPLAEQVPAIEPPGAVWLDRLVRIEAIDPGEAQLYSLAAERQLTLLTGDKRSLRSLPDAPDVLAALSGRIAILESVLLVLCERRGIEDVRAHVAPLAGSDVMVRSCFTPGNADPRVGLTSYLSTITAEVHPLLLWQPGSSQ